MFSDHLKGEQSDCVDVQSVRDIIETMDLFTDDELSDDLAGIMEHPVWDKMMLVKPQPIKEDEICNELCNLKGEISTIPQQFHN